MVWHERGWSFNVLSTSRALYVYNYWISNEMRSFCISFVIIYFINGYNEIWRFKIFTTLAHSVFPIYWLILLRNK